MKSVLVGVCAAMLIAGLAVSAYAWPKCTSYYRGCQVYQDWMPGGICCLSVGGSPCTTPEPGQTVGMIPTSPCVQCGDLRRTIFRPCGSQLGFCGDCHCSMDCE